MLDIYQNLQFYGNLRKPNKQFTNTDNPQIYLESLQKFFQGLGSVTV